MHYLEINVSGTLVVWGGGCKVERASKACKKIHVENKNVPQFQQGKGYKVKHAKQSMQVDYYL